MAQTLLPLALTGAGRAAPRRAPRPPFPPASSSPCRPRSGVPLSRWSRTALRRAVLAQGLVAEISGTTIWRWLSQDAIRPWRYRSWLFPRGPAFATKAGPILDLYAGRWQGRPLGPRADVGAPRAPPACSGPSHAGRA